MPYFKDCGQNQAKWFSCRLPGLEFGTDINVINKREHARDIEAATNRSDRRGDNSLITSWIKSLNATELCTSPTSSGPDVR